MKKSHTTKKSNKVVNLVVNIIVIILAIMILAVAISSIVSLKSGYNAMFGHALVAVRTNSMEGDKADSFNKGDLLNIKIISDEEKTQLKVGQIITFFDNINGKRQLNTHRIIEVSSPILQDGKVIAQSYVTKGDNAPGRDNVPVNYTEIIGVYQGSRAAGLGSFVLFVQSPTGFLVLVVLPSVALLIYALIRLILVLREAHKEKFQKEVDKQVAESVAAKAEITDDKKTAQKAELLEESSSDSTQNK